MIIFIKILNVILAVPILFKAVKKLHQGYINIGYFVLVFFWIFFILPLGFDIIFGLPNYDIYKFIGFKNAATDIFTTIVYLIFTLLFSYLFFLLSISKPIHIKDLVVNTHSNLRSKFMRLFFACLVLLPTMLAFIKIGGFNLHDIFDYFYYYSLFRSDNFLIYYYIAFLSIIAFIFYSIFSQRKVLLNFVYFAFPLFVALAINGKRTVIGYLFMLTFITMYMKRQISPHKMIRKGIFFASIIIFASIIYQSSVRSFKMGIFNEAEYTGFRIDFGRDDVLQMSIKARIDGKQIIDENGISNLYFLNFFGPKPITNYITTKYKYSVYATSFLLGLSETADLGWGMTTGLFDEFVSNFGIFFGLFFSLLFYIVISRFADKTRNAGIIVMTILLCMVTMLLQFTSIFFIIIIWFVYTSLFAIISTYKVRKLKKTCNIY